MDLCGCRSGVFVCFGCIYIDMEHIHLIGIGGTGLSAIARVLLQSGYKVSGSDKEYSKLARAVEADGAIVYVGHHPDQISGADIIVRSSAIPEDNIEVVEAMRLGIPVLKRSDFLGDLMKKHVSIAVAGTHGKTTTTSMISWLLMKLNLDPSFIVGGVVSNLGINARAGNGPHFVIEADEYDRMFHGLNPDIAVITNVEHDHPDMFKTESEFFDAFSGFIDRIKPGGTLIIWSGTKNIERWKSQAKDRGLRIATYGFEGTETDYQLKTMAAAIESENHFRVEGPNRFVQEIKLILPGEHNALNATAALLIVKLLGLSSEAAGQALSEFIGSGRRFDVRGEIAGITVIDDYAHHPTEIKATLSACRSRFPDQEIWAVWQPHTYSRTLTFYNEFMSAFADADHVYITPVYAARESKPEGFSDEQLARDLIHSRAYYGETFHQITNEITEGIKSKAVLIVFSAGDAIKISQEVYNTLSQKDRSRTQKEHRNV